MLGDLQAGDLFDFYFTTRDRGVPTTLAGSPAVSVYKANSVTQSIAGITLDVDFDGVTGLNHVRVDTTADGTFYANGNDFSCILTAGTISGVSVVGVVTEDFSLAHRSGIWASSTRTLTSFGTLVADVATAVWGAATRILTAGTNIVLAKGTGVTGFNDLDAAGVRTAVGLASANLDTQLDALPTATENADGLLARDLGSGSGAGVLDERTVRSALRFNRNKFVISAGTLTVYKEDDTTVAFTATITQTAGNPVSASDPA